MIWLLLLPLMLKGTNGETLTTSPLSNQIIVPLDPDTPFSLANCKKRSAMVEFQHLRVHGIEYTRKVLSSEDEECASGGAIPLLASDFPGCAKEAAAKGLNSFYFDDEGQCVSSNRPVLNEEDRVPSTEKLSTQQMCWYQTTPRLLRT
ncbi:hypothetical protein FHG87_005615 [Trinorchestia longiramus]|nr:hypothetical protein FHG87_005615 [Trinorchestia longiramus]